MFERFNDQARRVIVLGRDEARAFRHNYFGTEHLLLGMLAEGEGDAARTLDSFGITIDRVRDQLREVIGIGPKEPQGHVPFTPRAKKVMEFGLQAALSRGQKFIGTGDLLLGMIRDGEGVGAQILAKMGVDLEKTRRAALTRLESTGEESTGAAAHELPAPIPERTSYEPFQGPLCSMCKAPLAEKARHQVSDLPATVGAGVVQILIVFCSNCGDTIKVEILQEKA